jgi:hypothetical protein
MVAVDSGRNDFDGEWSYLQRQSWEMDVRYMQKWQKKDTTYLQVESTMVPNDLQLMDVNRNVVHTYTWTACLSGTLAYTQYITYIDTSSISEGIYFLYQAATNGTATFKFLSEPFWIKSVWPLTNSIKYKHSFNDYGVVWLKAAPMLAPFLTEDFYMRFRVECALMDFEPGRERTSYVNQVHDTATLKGVPYRQWKFYVGDVRGVAPWVMDLMNRIFVCDFLDYGGKLIQSTDGSKWEMSRAKGFPLVAGSIDVTEAFTSDSLQLSTLAGGSGGYIPAPGDIAPTPAGVVTNYNIETAFFGAGSLVPVTDVEKQG